MPDPNADNSTNADFVRRWSTSGSAERANYQLFLSELCDVIGVPRPDPTRPDDRDNAYVFEKPVTFTAGDGSHSTGRIDLYKRGCFVLEAKQGSDAVVDEAPLFSPTNPLLDSTRARRGTAIRGTAGWDAAMVKARNQADRYVHALPQSESNPPFILVVDVGHVIEVYADFSRLGRTYTPFPDSQTHRINLEDLAKEEIHHRLAAIWTDPLSLDPSRRSAKVTREVAADLAALARSLETSDHDPEMVSHFLMRLLFTLFAEDINLIAENRFTAELKGCLNNLENFPNIMRGIWKDMDSGAPYSPYLRQKVLQFNGSLFQHAEALPLTKSQLQLLISAAEKDWSDVEPAIFGTLLERALHPRERHKLGAHYTPRAYVERLVLPTVIEPLREQWEAAKAAAFTLAFGGDNAAARAQLHAYLAVLCKTTVLDPACGTGNFLYVTMEHMKRLEGEVRDALRQLGETEMAIEGLGLTVDPHLFLGLEINPRARDIADVVLWIGYLKWHLKTLGHPPNPPILKQYNNIKCQDAVLAYDKKELLLDESGKPVTRWDGHTFKKSTVTGEDVPDDRTSVPLYRYVHPRVASWPSADFVVGNPPFLGAQRFRDSLGDGYADALWAAHKNVAQSADLVMFWWNHAAELLRLGEIKRFGLITTNSITQVLNRRILERFISHGDFKLAFAIPDHPWVDSTDSAAVRIAMTVASKGTGTGALHTVIAEDDAEFGEATVKLSLAMGRIPATLSLGASVESTTELEAARGMATTGVKLHGDGFLISIDEAKSVGLGSVPSLEKHIVPLANGRDLVGRPRETLVVDFFGLGLSEVRQDYPQALQWLYDRVKPDRDQSRDESYSEKWWIMIRPRPEMRLAHRDIPRFIASCRTAKHRVFTFLSAKVLPESKIVAIASNDAFLLGVLSSRFHRVWALRVGGFLEDRPTYNHTDCFNKFAFPLVSDPSSRQIRDLGESLDAHRKRQQAAHPTLTITDMYNVLEKLRKNEELTDHDRMIHEQGLVSVLKQIHDDLDAAVAAAYGWPVDLTDEQILQKLVALNAERAEEEKRGIIRWLRPEFQNPGGAATTQQDLGLAKIETKPTKTKGTKLTWPKDLVAQISAVRTQLAAATGPMKAADVAKAFRSAKLEKVTELLAALEALGQARKLDGDRFAA